MIEGSAWRKARGIFEVRDTGIGMSPDVRERIFGRLFRADPSRHSTGMHAGLESAIVKEYVSALKGSIPCRVRRSRQHISRHNSAPPMPVEAGGLG